MKQAEKLEKKLRSYTIHITDVQTQETQTMFLVIRHNPNERFWKYIIFRIIYFLLVIMSYFLLVIMSRHACRPFDFSKSFSTYFTARDR